MNFFKSIKAWFVNLLGIARVDPRVIECATEDEARAKAQLEAGVLVAHGVVKFAPTGSMSPLIPTWGGFGVARYQPFGDAKLGTVAIYNATWFQAAPIAHRLVYKDKYGFIASGDNNAHSEPMARITAANYLGEVISIYRWPQLTA